MRMQDTTLVAREIILRGSESADLPDLSDAELAALIRTPRFDDALLMAAQSIVELYRGNRALNSLMSDRGRFLTGLMILDLHFVVGHGAGFTVAQLRAEAAAHNVCSPGRVTALIASLRLFGFLRSVPDDDRRVCRLVPTERFLALHRERWQRQFQALALLRPEMECAVAALAEPALVGHCAHAILVPYRHGVRMVDLVPRLRPVADRDAAMMMLFSLLIADTAGQSVSMAELARRFTVSRTHVRTVLRDAQTTQLVTAEGPQGGYRAGPALMDTLRRLFAVIFINQLYWIESACTAGVMTPYHVSEPSPSGA